MPSPCRYDKPIASSERHLGLFTTVFPRLRSAIQDVKYLDIGMPAIVYTRRLRLEPNQGHVMIPSAKCLPFAQSH